jgi:hypothetical protein
MKKLIPYSVYLPVEYHDKIKELAKQRKASSYGAGRHLHDR